jgi:hypothetical protein
MTQKIATLAAIALLVFGCGRSGQVQRNQQQYQTVQEGSASGVTSTINAPGETTPPMTDTNVDTTTNLTLPTNPNPLGNGTAAGSMASAMPSYPSGTPGMTATRPPRTTNAPVVTDTVGSTTPAMPKERTSPASPRVQRDRPQTDTAATETAATPPPTDTSTTDTTTTDTPSTTSTSSSTDTKKKDDGKKKDGDPSDQQQPPPPPPPPTATDTRG